ncbi:hypothetical protein CVT24_005538 [Panaeolus cyanescens]|uniref:N-acetyltransferase domain-containing protein n=1 Tax=Panaeolus cyanescens TaxID=181874 RepID=A0A409VQJ7_9AGAR|nr:hypothetical protein CVT24_005538 [Panaeolus cyanescens]
MSTKFIFRTVLYADLPALRDLVTQVFITREPTCSHLKVSTAGFNIIYDALMEKMDMKTTILAQDAQQGEIAAVMVNAPYDATYDENKIKEGLPFLQVLSRFNAPFRERVLTPRGIPESRVLHCALGATKAEFEGHGLFIKIMRESLRLAKKDPRWDLAVGECTSPITRHVTRDVFGWKEEASFRLKDFEVDGKKPFEKLEGEAALVWSDLKKQKL